VTKQINKGKHVHSRDPRKPAIVSALKTLSGASKVTLLKEVAPGIFEGSCLEYKPEGGGSAYVALGRYTVDLRTECVVGGKTGQFADGDTQASIDGTEDRKWAELLQRIGKLTKDELVWLVLDLASVSPTCESADRPEAVAAAFESELQAFREARSEVR
jgi:hypothetical protein